MSIKSILVKAALLVLVGIAFASCSSSREQSQETPTQLSTIPTPVPTHIHDEVEKETQDSNIDLSAGYSFPAKIDPTNHYLFYLHGKIIEDQGLPAISPEFG